MPALKARAPNHVNSREPYQKEGIVLISRLGCPMCGSGSAHFFRFRLLQSCQLYSSCSVPLRDFARVSCTVTLQNVAQRGVLRALREFRPLRCRELSVKVVQDAVEYMPLPLVQGEISETLPEAAFREHGSESRLRAFDG